jgi:hypothetical protein
MSGSALAQSVVILRCALLRASKDEHGPQLILRGSLRSHLRMTADCAGRIDLI